MRDISAMLKHVYRAHSAVVVPGSGTFGMEAVARQFATGKKVLVHPQRLVQLPLDADLRHGRASRRDSTVLKARQPGAGPPGAVRAAADRRSGRRDPRASGPPWCSRRTSRPRRGIMLPDDYLRAVADAVHAVGGLFVLDCIASGAMWVDMEATRRRRADQRAAKGLEQLAVLRDGDAERARAHAPSTAPPAPASPAT